MKTFTLLTRMHYIILSRDTVMSRVKFTVRQIMYLYVRWQFESNLNYDIQWEGILQPTCTEECLSLFAPRFCYRCFYLLFIYLIVNWSFYKENSSIIKIHDKSKCIHNYVSTFCAYAHNYSKKRNEIWDSWRERERERNTLRWIIIYFILIYTKCFLVILNEKYSDLN